MADVKVFENDGAVIVEASVAGQNAFDFDFLLYEADSLVVTFQPVGLPSVPLVLGSTFTVSGLGQANGGAVNFIGAAAGLAAVGDKVLIYRSTRIRRLFDYQNAGDFRADVVNREFDLMIMIDQENRRDIDRSVKVAAGLGIAGPEIAIGANGTVPRWDENGNLVEGPSGADIENAEAYAAQTREDYLAAQALLGGLNGFWSSLLTTTTAVAAWVGLKINGHLTTRAAIKALIPIVGLAAYMSEPGREGQFAWREGNFAAAIADDTQEGLYLKANTVASNLGAWVRVDVTELNIKWFGATGIDSFQDAAIDNWFKHVLKLRIPGYAPAGNYRHSNRILVDMQVGAGSAPMIRGDGAYRTTLIASATTPNAIHFFHGGVPDVNGQKVHTYGVVKDMGFLADSTGPVFTLGGDDLVDTAGNYVFDNVFFANVNSMLGTGSALHLNYVFDSTFRNIVCVGNVGYGDALNLRQAHFCTFIGGSYSNAINGIVANGYNYANTFLSPDFENVLVGWLNVQAADEANQLINPFFDIYNPLTGVSAGVAVRSLACGPGGITLDNPYLQPRANSALIDTASQANVFLRGPARPAVVTPAFPASDGAVTNNTGRTIAVRFSNGAGTLSAVFINAEETQLTGGTVVVLPRQTIAPRYTGIAPVWRWQAIV